MCIAQSSGRMIVWSGLILDLIPHHLRMMKVGNSSFRRSCRILQTGFYSYRICIRRCKAIIFRVTCCAGVLLVYFQFSPMYSREPAERKSKLYYMCIRDKIPRTRESIYWYRWAPIPQNMHVFYRSITRFRSLLKMQLVPRKGKCRRATSNQGPVDAIIGTYPRFRAATLRSLEPAENVEVTQQMSILMWNCTAHVHAQFQANALVFSGQARPSAPQDLDIRLP